MTNQTRIEEGRKRLAAEMRKDIPIKVVQVEFLWGWATAQSIALASYQLSGDPEMRERESSGCRTL
jgi:hypothetical protein